MRYTSYLFIGLLLSLVLHAGCPTTPPQETPITQESTPEKAPSDAASVEPTQEVAQELHREPLPDTASTEKATEQTVEARAESPTLPPDQAEQAPERSTPPEVRQDSPTPDGPTPDNSDKECTFNSDCPSQERCECDENTGCFCKFGTRGTGKNGVDVCTNGNDCETALCVEGNGGSYYCSGPCQQDGDCKTQLPVCADISFLGKICIRKKQ